MGRPWGWWFAAAGLLALSLGVTALPGRADATCLPPPYLQCQTLSNPASIDLLAEISPGKATPYPSPITVSGMNGVVARVTVTLFNIRHTYQADLDVLLVGPGGETVILLSDAGGEFDFEDVTLTFDDAATGSDLPSVNQKIASGTYRPFNLVYQASDDQFPGAPAGPYGRTLSAFSGTNPNGEWRLYVHDDKAFDGGQSCPARGLPGPNCAIAGGWSLTITTLNPLPTNAYVLTRTGSSTVPQEILGINTGQPTVVNSRVRVTRLAQFQSALAIDVRPTNGWLYVLGSNHQLYVIDPRTGLAFREFVPVAYPLDGTAFGMDFDPVNDVVRITTSSSRNYKLNPTTGDIAGPATSLFYVPGDPRFGQVARVTGVAYGAPGGGSTPLWGFDYFFPDVLVRVGGPANNPDNGELATVGNLGVDVQDFGGLKYLDGKLLLAATQMPFFDEVSVLYEVNTATGAASPVGGSLATAIIGGGFQIIGFTAYTLQGPGFSFVPIALKQKSGGW